MFVCYPTIAEVKAYAPNLDQYFWEGYDQTNFDSQLSLAASLTQQALIRNNNFLRKMMPELVLREIGTSALSATSETTDSFVDDNNRLRLVIDCRTFTGSGTKTVTLQGGNSETGDFVTVTTLNITATGVTSKLFYKTYTRYKISFTQADGTINYEAFLVDTQYDEMIYNKVLEIITRSAGVPKTKDSFDLIADDFKLKFEELASFYRIPNV